MIIILSKMSRNFSLPSRRERPPALNTTSGGQRDTWEATGARLVDRIGELVEYAARRGVTVAIVYDTSTYTGGIAKQVRQALTNAGVKIVLYQPFAENKLDEE